MMTHASTTFPWSRSFSVHVEMYSLGSYACGRRSSLTTCWRRIEGGSNVRGRKNLCGSPAVAYRGEAQDRSPGDEDECEEPQPPRDIGGEDDARVERQRGGEVNERLVQDEQHEAEREEPDPAARASMPVHHDRCGLVVGALDRRLRRHGRGRGHGRPLRTREVGGRISPARIAPPPLVSIDPAKGRTAVGARVLRPRDRRVSAAGVAIPAAVLGDVRELAAARGTRVLDLRDFASGGDLLDDDHGRGRTGRFG